MNKIFKLFLIVSLTLILGMNVKAANGYINVKSSSNTIIVGRTFTTTVTISSTVPLGSWEYSLSYDSSLLKLEKGTLYVVDYGNGTLKSKSYTYTFKALKSGTATIGVKSYAGYAWDESKLNITSGSSKIKLLTQAQLESTYSKNNNLKELSITGETLEPTFNKDILNYKVNLKPNVEVITIKAKAEDAKSRVDGIGIKEVTEGINKFEIIITAQNGNIKKYTIEANVEDKNPIEVTINNEIMTVIKRESLLKTPDGFIKNKVNINDTEIPSLYNQENDLILIGLKNKNGDINLFIYNNINNTYYPYTELTFDRFRILPLTLKKDDNLFKRYKEYNILINNTNIKVYKLNKDSNYSVFYGLDIEKGLKNYYKYDSNENSIIKFENEEAALLDKEINKQNKIKLVLIISNVVVMSLLITSISIIGFKTLKKKNTK